MDITNLPKGYYYDPVQGQIEDFTTPTIAPDAVAANTFILYHEVSGGLVGHAIARDELGYLFMAVAKADFTQPHPNPNIRWVDTYMAQPGSLVFDPTPIDHWQPPLKIDTVQILVDGKDVIVSDTTHAAQEAPRPTEVPATRIVGVAHQKTTPREGPCGPLGIPYFRPQNNLTRGQECKITVLALEATGYEFPPYDPNKQYFEDVPVGSAFHEYTAKLASIGAIGGYACVPQQP